MREENQWTPIEDDTDVRVVWYFKSNILEMLECAFMKLPETNENKLLR